MKLLRELARILLLILLVVSEFGCTSIPTCNDEGNGATRALHRNTTSAVGCPKGGGGGGGGGGGAGSCNSQLTPSSALFGVNATGMFEEWEINPMGELFLTCNSGQSAIGQTVVADGKFVYTLDITKPQIFGFSMSTGGRGALTAIPSQPFALSGTFDASDFMVADPLGRFILLPSFSTNKVHVLRISATGALSEVTNSPFSIPSLNGPNMIAIDPTGSFVYVADPVDGDIFVATLDSGGQLVFSPIPIITQSAPVWLAVHPNGHFLYSGDVLDVETFSITPITGGLVEVGTPLDISGFGADPNMLAIDSTGSFLYLLFGQTGLGANVGILGFGITGGTGTLSQLQATVFTGSNSAAISQMITDPFQANMFLVSAGGIFNVPVNTANGSLTIPALTVVTGTTPTTTGNIAISSVP